MRFILRKKKCKERAWYTASCRRTRCCGESDSGG
jgi:hypothetical protein